MSSEDILFQTAVEAVKNGERQRARDLITRLLKTNRDNAEYWLWMSAVVESPKESVYCLKEALKLDPENYAARRGLIMAGELPIDESMVIPFDPQHQARRSKPSTKSSRWKQFMGAPLWMKIAGGVGALLLIVAIIYLLTAGFGKTSRQDISKQPPSTLDLPTFSAATPTLGTPQPTATFPGPTPLSMLQKATYTPTVLYVNTPHPSTENYRSAMRAFERKDWEAMLNFIEQAIPFEPDAPDLHYYAGEAYRMMEDLENAKTSYEAALEADPDFAPASLGLGRTMILEDPENMAMAKIEIRKAVKSDPGFVEAYLELAKISLEEGNIRVAEDYLEQAEALAPQSAFVALLHSQILFEKGQLDNALVKVQEAHELDMTMLPAYRILGEIYLLRGDHQKAAAHLNTYTLFINDDPDALAWLARAHAGLEEYDLGFKAADLALQIDPQHHDALVARGRLYLTEEKGFLAVNDFLAALKLQPESFEVLAGLGQAYLLENFDRVAYNRLSNAFALAEADSQLALVYYWRAQALENLEEIGSAIQDWQALLDLDDENIPPQWLETAEEHLQALPTPTNTPIVIPTRTPTRTESPTPAEGSTATPTP